MANTHFTGVTVLLANEGLEELVGTTTGQKWGIQTGKMYLWEGINIPNPNHYQFRIALFEQVQHIHIDIPLAGNRHLGVGKGWAYKERGRIP